MQYFKTIFKKDEITPVVKVDSEEFENKLMHVPYSSDENDYYEDRTKDILEIEKSLIDLHDIVYGLNEMVKDQGESIDIIVENTEKAAHNTKIGIEKLEQANDSIKPIEIIPSFSNTFSVYRIFSIVKDLFN